MKHAITNGRTNVFALTHVCGGKGEKDEGCRQNERSIRKKGSIRKKKKGEKHKKEERKRGA